MSAKHPTLFDVPKDSPSRKERLDAFKSANGIETHHTPGMTREEGPWMACHMPTARTAGYGVTETSDLFDVVMHVGMLLDDAGVITYGATEREAVEELCGNIGLLFDL